MSEVLQFALLGVGSAAIYALAGQGIVAIYRGSGVLNFAQGGLALMSASVFYEVFEHHGLPLAVSFIIAVLASAIAGALIHLLVIRPLADASPTLRMIATVGVLSVLSQGVLIVMGSETRLIASFFPREPVEFGDSIAVGEDRLIIFAIAVALTAALSVLYSRTRFGYATAAVAYRPLAASVNGISPTLVGVVNWSIGGALAGLAGVLILPITGLSPTALTLVVLPGLAAALVGGFSSQWLTLAGAIAIGMGESLLVRYGDDIFGPIPGLGSQGWAEALPFVLIVVVLVVRSSALPERGEITMRLPRIMRGRPPLALMAGAAAVTGVLLFLVPDGFSRAIGATLLAGLVGMSVVLLTGWTGQISLGQYAMAGVGALTAARLSDAAGLPWLLCVLAGLGAAVAAGALFALPALRSRGLSLAIVTFGLGVAVQRVLFDNPDYTGGFSGTRVSPPKIFGVEFSSAHPERYGLVILATVVVVGFVLLRVRESSAGRRLIAVRNSERAAASLGVSVGAVKVAAFAAAAGIAGLAGVLSAFRFESVQYAQYGFLASLQVVVLTMIGGIGSLAGALVGATLVVDGVVEYSVSHFSDAERYLVMFSGVGVILTLVQNPDGLVFRFPRFPGRARPAVDRRPIAAVDEPRRRIQRLTVEGLSVSFGGNKVVDDVDLVVRTGAVTGLIGANGAGKTTVIDALSGFVRSSGRVCLDDRDVSGMRPHRRVRLGLGRSFQGVELFDDLTVRENLAVATEAAGHLDLALRPGVPALGREVDELVEILALAPYLDTSPTELPQGIRRLVGVARVAATGASMLMLDEPAAGLDEEEAAELGRALRRLADDFGLGILLVEHSVGLVASVSDDLVVLDFGQVIFRGSPADALVDERVMAAYLGSAPGPSTEAGVR